MMKKKFLTIVFVALGATMLHGANFYHKNDNGNIQLPGSWWMDEAGTIAATGAPGENDWLIWSGDLITGGYSTSTSGISSLYEVYGVKFVKGTVTGDPLGGGQSLGASGTLLGIGAGGLTIGDGSGADVYMNQQFFQYTADQTWYVAAGRTLTLDGSGTLPDSSDHTITLTGAGTYFFRNNPGNVLGGASVRVGGGVTLQMGLNAFKTDASWELLSGTIKLLAADSTRTATLHPSVVVNGNTTLGIHSRATGNGYTQLAASGTITGTGNLTIVNNDNAANALNAGLAAADKIAWVTLAAPGQAIQLNTLTIGANVHAGFGNSGSPNCAGTNFVIETGGKLGLAQLGGSTDWAWVATVTMASLSGGGQIFSGRNGGTLTIDGASGTYDFSGQVTDYENNGTHYTGITKKGASTQKFSGSNNIINALTVNGGKLVLGSATSVNNFVRGGISVGVGTDQANASLDIYGTASNGTTVTVNNSGAMTVYGNFTAGTTTTLGVNNGSVEQSGTLTVASGGVYNATGVTNFYHNSKLTVNGTYNSSSATTITSGSLLNGTGTYNGDLTVNNGGTVASNGTVNGTVSVLGGGTIGGTGTYADNVTVAATGILNGDGATFSKGLTLATGTIWNVTSHEGITVEGLLSLTGTGTITLNYDLSAGTFVKMEGLAASECATLFNCTAGAFDMDPIALNLNTTGLPEGITIGVDGKGRLYFKDYIFIPIPEPSTWALLGAGAAFVTIFRRRRANEK